MASIVRWEPFRDMMALREAMERSQTDNEEDQEPSKKASKNNTELEGIFSRTLEQKK